MGQKVNPTGIRLGSFLPWKSRWFSDDAKFKEYLLEDVKIRKVLSQKLKIAGVSNIEIERLPKSIAVIITVARPGVVIGRGGTGLEDIKKYIVEIIREARGGKVSTKDIKIDLRVNEIKNPDLSAYLVASRIAGELERRIPHRRVVTKAVEKVMQSGATGVKVILSGRIDGADIARTEKYRRGSVPTQTFRENIDYAQVPALLKRGYVGIKVYIHKSE